MLVQPSCSKPRPNVDSVRMLKLLPVRSYPLALTLALVEPHRASVSRCQVRHFNRLVLYDEFKSNERFKKMVARKWKMLEANPSLARKVRVVDITIGEEHNTTLFGDPTFLKMLALLRMSPVPPHTFRLEQPSASLQPENLLKALVQSSLHQTLKEMSLKTLVYDEDYTTIPLSIFPLCSNLKGLSLRDFKVMKTLETQFVPEGVDLKPPRIESLDYRHSAQIVEHLLRLPAVIEPLVDLTNLRFLKTCAHERSDMLCVQPILDATSETLEELDLTTLSTSDIPHERLQLALATLVNLKPMSKLRSLALYGILNWRRDPLVLRDFAAVLRSLPILNSITQLLLKVSIYSKHPFQECLMEDWEGICEEVVRVAAGKPLKFHLDLTVEIKRLCEPTPGDAVLYGMIEDRVRAALSDYPHIRFHPLNSISR
ncbi:unnamed protein product [Cyclocybe aegerita]|uniref:Uncharacterized protein n=1 Tax=Cyclocybe aegerita TaxID=1973307 RepID=A0A8S0XTC5_CYCAE|nr:unnamed protein product [Cyclocybe aegerita]